VCVAAQANKQQAKAQQQQQKTRISTTQWKIAKRVVCMRGVQVLLALPCLRHLSSVNTVLHRNHIALLKLAAHISKLMSTWLANVCAQAQQSTSEALQ
jgi:hypothetical protein